MPKDKIETSKKLISYYKKVFSTPEGKAVLHNLMDANFLLNSTLSENCTPISLASKEGQRNAILRILTILKMNPEQFNQIQEEEGSHV